jgi:hypothetical protein
MKFLKQKGGPLMKKLITVFLAVFFAFGMAQAGEQVYIQAPDNPGIPAGSCQAISQIILGLSGNVTLRAGDVGQFNLPVGITVCKDIDFFVGNSQARLVSGLAATTYGPMELFKVPTTGGGAGVYIRVQASTGSQSVVLTVIGGSTADWVGMGGGDKELALRIRLFDRAIWAGAPGAAIKYNANDFSHWLYTDGNGDGVITPPRSVDAAMFTPPTTDKNDGNAICIQTPANWTAIVTAAFESQDILNPGIPKWDFTNDPAFEAGDNVIYVANILSATAFECLPICKDDDWDYVPITSVGQTAGSCMFDYNTAAGYCTTPAPAWTGNRLAIKKTSNFASGDYELVVTVTGDGTWFNGASAVGVWGYALGTANDVVCTTTAASVVDATYYFTQTGPRTAPAGDTNCDVALNERITRLVIDLGALNPFAIIKVWIPSFQYHLADVASGDEVQVTLDLVKKPCGSIFTCTEKVAEYIDVCSVVVPTVSDCWTFPYFPPINDAVWWNGAAFANCSSMDATCNLSFYESDGDLGTYTLTLGPWGAWSGLWTSLSASIVPDAGNAGSIGDATFFICICCQPGAGAAAGSPVSAIGMMGTGNQAHGYDLNAY